MIKQMEITCYDNICDYTPDTDYDYFILHILTLIIILYICNI